MLKKQEIRILKPKMSDEKTNSFFYDDGVAHGIRSDGRAVLLIATGDIRMRIGEEEYDKSTKEKAIEKYGLTDEKLIDLQDEGTIIFENNNWFEVIWTSDENNSWELVSDTVRYDYDSAMEMFKDCYNRKSLNGNERKIEVTLTDAEIDKDFLEWALLKNKN